MANGWDSSTLKKLKTLFGRGLSTSEIGRKLGLSKNAVVGKINRLGWNNDKKGKTAPKKTEKPSKKTPVKTPVKTPAKKTVKPVAKPIAKEPVKTTTKKATKPVVKKTPVPKTSTKTTQKPTTKVDTVKTGNTTPEKTKTASKKTNKDLAVHQRIIQHSLEMANLKPNQCRWPIGDPDSEHFHFCGEPVFTGKPYCYEHCRQAYQFTPPKKKQA